MFHATRGHSRKQTSQTRHDTIPHANTGWTRSHRCLIQKIHTSNSQRKKVERKETEGKEKEKDVSKKHRALDQCFNIVRTGLAILPASHVCPVYPKGHAHANVSTKSVQVPPRK